MVMVVLVLVAVLVAMMLVLVVMVVVMVATCVRFQLCFLSCLSVRLRRGVYRVRHSRPARRVLFHLLIRQERAIQLRTMKGRTHTQFRNESNFTSCLK